jgi:hypothetical protein
LPKGFFYSGVVSAAAAALVLIPSAGSTNGDPLLVGNVANSATADTQFMTTGLLGLRVLDSSPGAIALQGSATASTGTSDGVLGTTSSSGPNSSGVVSALNQSTPDATSDGVKGQSGSTTAGPGVFGWHYAESGSAPGVVGQTNSTSSARSRGWRCPGR